MNIPCMNETIFAVSPEGLCMIASSTFLLTNAMLADPQLQDLSPYHQSVLIIEIASLQVNVIDV